MRMSKQHFDFIADQIGPLLHWPTAVHEIADKLAATNPRFDREKFVSRAVNAWEQHHHAMLEDITDDEIPY